MNTEKIQKINSLIENIMNWQKQVRNKELIIKHLYKRLEMLENE